MFDNKPQRRTFLKTAGVAGAVALAGCAGSSSGGSGATENESSGSGTTESESSGSESNGATTGSGGTGSSTEITWLHDRDAGKETINEMIDEYNDQNPNVKVKAQLTPSGTGTAEELQKMRAAGDPPEILWFTFGQAYRFAREGVLAPLNDVVEENGLRTFSDREDSFMATSIVGPVTWHYRTDLYDNPETFKDYLQQAKRIDEEEDITPLQIPNGETTLADSLAVQLLWNGGVNIWDGPSDDIKFSMASGNNRERAIQTYEWIQNAYQYASNGNGLAWGDAATAYQEGSAASVPYISMWIPTLYLAEKPDLRENTANGFHPIAKNAQNDRKFAWFEGNMLWDTENKDLARDFLMWFHAEEQQRRFISSNAGDYIPPTKEGMSADWYRSNDAVHEGMIEMFTNEAENFTPPVATGTDGELNYPAVSNGLIFSQALARLLHDGESPSGTVDWLQSNLEM